MMFNDPTANSNKLISSYIKENSKLAWSASNSKAEFFKTLVKFA